MPPCLAPFLLAALVATSQDPGVRYFEGEARVGELAWELGLWLREDGTLSVDLTSDWWLDAPLTEVELEEDASGTRLGFGLPLALGRASARVEEGKVGADRIPAGRIPSARIRGSLRLADGREGTLALAEQPVPRWRAEEVRLEVEGAVLAGTLGLPEGPGPFSALVFVHGGGPAERSMPATRFLAEYLPRHGIACLVTDKRGCGASTGDWRAIGFSEAAEDVRAEVAFLGTRAEIDAHRVGLYAGSQGGWVASLAASREPAIRFVVNHSAPVVTPFEADGFALESSLRRAGLGDEVVASARELWRLECEALRRGQAPDAYAPLLEAIAAAHGEAWFARAPYEATPASSWWCAWYTRILDHDPLPLLATLDIPMLWLYGARDSQSDPVVNLTLLAELVRDHARPFTIHVFPGAGHGIMLPMDAQGNDLPPLTMGQGYFRILVDWILAQAGTEPANSPPRIR